MMPSRGLRLVQSSASRLNASQYRSLSTSSPNLRNISYSARSPLSRPFNPSLKPRFHIPLAGHSIRHASTTPSAQPASSTASTTSAAEAQSFPDLDTITLDNIDFKTTSDIADIPEQIGYLSQIGIDYGIGPTSAIQWVLEHLHIYAGLPWWASIAATAVAMRVVMFPFYLKSSDSMARQTALLSVTKPITDRMTAAQKAGDTASVMLAWRELGEVRKRAGIRLSDQFVPPLMQGVLGYCGFKLMRAMATLPVPGLLDGGFLWITDLTITDGYLIMPAIMAASMHFIFRMGGESANASANASMTAGMKKFLLYGMPAFVGLITAFQPGAVCMWFAGSGAIGIVQIFLLQNARVRNFFGLAPMYRPVKGEAAQGLLASMLSDRAAAQSSTTSSARMTYQAPRSRTIDTTLVRKSGPEMVQPNAQNSGGIFGSISKMMNDTKEKVKRERQVDPKAEFKRRADVYEERAQKRKGRR